MWWSRLLFINWWARTSIVWSREALKAHVWLLKLTCFFNIYQCLGSCWKTCQISEWFGHYNPIYHDWDMQGLTISYDCVLAGSKPWTMNDFHLDQPPGTQLPLVCLYAHLLCHPFIQSNNENQKLMRNWCRLQSVLNWNLTKSACP